MPLLKLVTFAVGYFLYHSVKVVRYRMVVIQMLDKGLIEMFQCLLHYLEQCHQAYCSLLASMEGPSQIHQMDFIEEC